MLLLLLVVGVLLLGAEVGTWGSESAGILVRLTRASAGWEEPGSTAIAPGWETDVADLKLLRSESDFSLILLLALEEARSSDASATLACKA